MFTLSQAWAWRRIGPQRFGVFGYLATGPTAAETDRGIPIPGTGSANKSIPPNRGAAQLWVGTWSLSRCFPRL